MTSAFDTSAGDTASARTGALELVTTSANPAPPGGVPAMLQTADGHVLRAVRWHPPGAQDGMHKGTVVIAGGRGEFVEKYFETVGELLARGLVVVAFDWRGQGLSGRDLDDRRKGHIDDFTLYERDLETISAQVLDPFCPKPWFGLGHSMGASVLLVQARQGRSPFERLVVTAPMVALRNLPADSWVRSLCALLDLVGLGGLFVPRLRRRPARPTLGPFAGNKLTSDAARFDRLEDLMASHPYLAIGDPTIGWLNAAFRQMEAFQDPDFPRRMGVPTLVFAAGEDPIVDVQAVEHFAKRLKAGRLIVIDRARHEILSERDVLRQQFWAGFDAFVPGEHDEMVALETAQALLQITRTPWWQNLGRLFQTN